MPPCVICASFFFLLLLVVVVVVIIQKSYIDKSLCMHIYSVETEQWKVTKIVQTGRIEHLTRVCVCWFMFCFSICVVYFFVICFFFLLLSLNAEITVLNELLKRVGKHICADKLYSPQINKVSERISLLQNVNWCIYVMK